MKHRVSAIGTAVLAITFAAADAADAQVVLGLGGGLVSSTFVGDAVDDLDPESEIGFSIGGWLSFPMGTRISLVPGAHYVQKGASATEAGVGTSTFSINYLEFPLLLSVRVTPPESGVGVSLFAGPAASVEIGCTLSATNGTSSASADCDDAEQDERQTLDFSGILGGGVTFPLTDRLGLAVSGGADFGLRSLDTSEDEDDVKNRAFFGTVALTIPVGN